MWNRQLIREFITLIRSWFHNKLRLDPKELMEHTLKKRLRRIRLPHTITLI